MTNINEDDLDDDEFLLSVCAGLVTVSRESGQVGLVRKWSVAMSRCVPYSRKQTIQLSNFWNVFGALGHHFFLLLISLSAVLNICLLTCPLTRRRNESRLSAHGCVSVRCSPKSTTRFSTMLLKAGACTVSPSRTMMSRSMLFSYYATPGRPHCLETSP